MEVTSIFMEFWPIPGNSWCSPVWLGRTAACPPGLPLLFAGLWLAAWADGYPILCVGATLGFGQTGAVGHGDGCAGRLAGRARLWRQPVALGVADWAW